MAPIARSATPLTQQDEKGEADLYRLQRLSEDSPETFGPPWLGADNRVHIGIRRGDTNAATVARTRSQGLVQTDMGRKSLAELRTTMGRVTGRKVSSHLEEAVTSVMIDPQGDRVIVGVDRLDEDIRKAVAAELGADTAVQLIPRAEPMAGPDSYRDRSPYFGAAGYGESGDGFSGRAHCSTAFSMLRGSSQRFQVTAAHCSNSAYRHRFPAIKSPASLDTSSTKWSNVLGSYSSTYPTTLNASDGGSALIGTTRYGDIRGISVSNNSATIWGGGRTGKTYAVTDQETGYTPAGASVCVDGANGGINCGLVVQRNFTAVKYPNYLGNTVYVQPVVYATGSSASCPVGGDSGGAVYRPNPGIKASGIYSGGANVDGTCHVYYTSIYFAQALYKAGVVR